MNVTKAMETLKNDGVAIAAANLLTHALDKLSTAEVHFGWSILKLVEKAAGKRTGEMRERLLNDAKKNGVKTDKGHYVLALDYGKVTAQRKVLKAKVDQKAVYELLKGKGIPKASVLVKKTSQAFDQKAFESLVKEGQISEEEAAEVMGTAEVSYSLVVEQPSFLPKELAAGSDMELADPADDLPLA